MDEDLIIDPPNCAMVSSRRAVQIIFGLLATSCLWSYTAAQEMPLPHQLHPWGMFEPGAWKLVRITTENINEQGAVTQVSTSDSKTTLIDVEDDGVTLEMKVSVEVAGKHFDTEAQTVKQGFHGEVQTSVVKVKEPLSGEVVVEERKIPCQSRVIESAGPSGNTTTTIYYSPLVSPYILERKTVTTDNEGKTILNETNVSVEALEMPCKILGSLHSAAQVKTVQKSPLRGTIVTLAVICPEVPGGIVSHTSKELDPTGRLIRRSILELVDFSTEPEKDRSGFFGRKRPSRYRAK